MTVDMQYLTMAFICAYGIILAYDIWLDLKEEGKTCSTNPSDVS